ncbi:Carboxypeptidase regulatory-like domain-containing protein [Bryocella elongata]|uniref:Carboxypeptidase regulatory-like domain-containing protein n=1 Tax=Bryocella elongata TaxID=863522 RepID=A0A1H5URM1_9BACT|nr:carboxypeptidase-like regulatory domain-containing protein [Bryocella elongata]SEF77679.1 Carboxypeptidase regulatory-like domain-containing protein [Bryocella elongata]
MTTKHRHSRRRPAPTLWKASIAILYALVLMPMRQIVAQAVSSAKMHGTITDNTGAVVSGASVTATQTASGATVTAVTGDDGSYVLSNLPVGAYTVKVVAAGFQVYSRTGLVLEVSNDAEVDAPLTVGSTQITVTVDATAAQVQTEDTSISTVVDQNRVVDLPLNGRNAANLVLLSGASAPTVNGNMTSTKSYGSTGTSAIGGSLNIAVAGGQGNQINYLLDGGDHNDSFSNVNMPFPFPDALQEFSVQTTGMSAQYGVHPSAAVNIVTKSGSNQWHGGAFEFLRNSYANANNRINGYTDLKRNQFGGYFGGPILRDKLFFFGGYQHTALRIAPATTSSFVPTAAMLAGNFTPYLQYQQSLSATNTCPALLASAGFTYNATTCTATISTTLFSPAAVALMKYLPTASTQNAAGLVSYSVPAPQDENQWIGRLDYNLNSRHSVFARYFMTNYYQKAIFNGNLLNAVNPGLKDRGKYLTLGDTYVISPRMTNALRAAVTRLAIARGAPGDLISPATLGTNVFSSVPNYIYLNVSGAFTASCGSCAPTHYVTNHYQAADDLSIQKGSHFIQLGFDYIHEELNLAGLNTENGQFTFNGSYSGLGLADLLLGAPNTFSQGYGPGAAAHLRYNYFGYYVLDTWHASKKLTINAGLRWEPWFPEYEKNNIGGEFSPAAFASNTVSSVYTNAPAGIVFYGDKGVKPGFINSRFTNFSPRAGFAFDPKGNGMSSIRGSYTLTFEAPELYYDSGFPGNSPNASAQSFTVDNSTNETDSVKSFDNPWKKITGGNPYPTQYPAPSTAAFPATNVSTGYYPSNLRRTYMHQYNFSYQNQVSTNWLASLSYIGTSTIHLWGFQPYNYATPAATPTGAAATTNNTSQRYILYRAAIANGTTAGTRYGAFSGTADYGMANFNGVVATINRRFTHNYSVLLNYTWSHCLSNMNYTGDNTPPAQDPTNHAAEYGSCNFDTTHNLTISGVASTPKLHAHLLNTALGAWQLSPLVTYRTGMPYTVTDGTDRSLTAIGQDRPNLVAGQSLYAKNLFPAAGVKPLWINASAYSLQTLGTFGNERPLQARGPGFANVDLAISKRFPILERAQLELRGEAFNVLNHPNYANPNTAISSSSTFGRITATANDARLLQIAAKVTF